MAKRTRETTDVRQQQITDAALQVIGLKGINGATTVEIASAAGISEGNLYRHFKNKEEIIKSVIAKIGIDLASILASVAEINDPQHRLEIIFKRHLLYLEGHVGIPRTIFSEETIVTNDNLRAKVRSTISMHFQGIRKIVEQGQNIGVFDEGMDPQAITSMFIGTIHFAVTQWMMNNFSTKLTDEAEVLWKNFARGITRKY